MTVSEGPLAAYRADLATGEFLPDPGQLAAAQRLEALYRRLRKAPPGWFARLCGMRDAGPAGIYLWGGVGRGKTYLMDLLHDALPGAGIRRTHFHAFMLEVHAALRALKDTPQPLTAVAHRYAREVRVLCLDELQVHDVADAMVLGPLLEGLLARGVALVVTSNRHPDALYEHGLQRERFLPAIALLKQHLEVVALDGPVDYRARALADLPRYHVPLGARADAALAAAFRHLVPVHAKDGPIEVDGRPIATRGWSSDVGWFDFQALCATPRSARDYLALAERFHTLILSDVPVLEAHDYDVAHRFMNLVDVLYDAGTHLIVSAAAAPGLLYRGERLGLEFRRTVSRLTEMQSTRYARARPPLD